MSKFKFIEDYLPEGRAIVLGCPKVEILLTPTVTEHFWLARYLNELENSTILCDLNDDTKRYALALLGDFGYTRMNFLLEEEDSPYTDIVAAAPFGLPEGHKTLRGHWLISFDECNGTTVIK
jgi:hypothetical protein